MSKTSRKWCFTCFKMDTDFAQIFKEYHDIIRFLIIGQEICPKTKKQHWQGYIQMYDPCRLTKIQFIFEDKCHLESQRGNDFQASDYCKKDKKYISFGTPTKQGARTDLENLKKIINNNASHMECYNEHFSSYLKYRGYFDKYRECLTRERAKKFRNVEVEILSGPTRSGKTRKYLYNEDGSYNDSAFKINCNDLDWFDGYEGQEILILDEFKNQVKLTKLLDLLDGHICRLSIKGCHTYALWTKVIITTNLKKKEIFPNITKDLIAPFWARVHKFIDLWPKCPEVTKGNTIALVPVNGRCTADSFNLTKLNRFRRIISMSDYDSDSGEYSPLSRFTPDNDAVT